EYVLPSSTRSISCTEEAAGLTAPAMTRTRVDADRPTLRLSASPRARLDLALARLARRQRLPFDSTVLAQDLDDRRILHLKRYVQRRVSQELILHVDVGTVVEQRLDDLLGAPERCHIERSPPPLVSGVDVRSFRDEQVSRGEIRVRASRGPQRRVA